MSSTAGHGGSSGAAASSGSGGSSGTGGSSGSGGSSGAAGQQPACNDLVLDAPDYAMSSDPGMQPAAKGGSIVDGTYFVMGTVWYGQAAGLDLPLGRAKFVLSGDTWEEVEDLDASTEDDSHEPTQHYTYTATTSGTSVTVVPTCPTATTQTFGYTAEGTSLTLHILDHGEPFDQKLERQ